MSSQENVYLLFVYILWLLVLLLVICSNITTYCLDMVKRKVSTVNNEQFKATQINKRKMQSIMQKIKEELQVLEVEWLHLRGMVNENSTVPSVTKDSEPVNNANKYDDIDLINSEKFILTSLRNMSQYQYGKEENDSSENED